jgi:hypothetical protein
MPAFEMVGTVLDIEAASTVTSAIIMPEYTKNKEM